MVIDSLKDKIREVTGSKDEEESSPDFQIKSASEDLVVIPEQENIRDVDVRYPLIEPFADAHISWNEDQEELVYQIEEPSLNTEEQHKFDRIKGAMEKKIDYLGEKLDEVAKELGIRMSDQERAKLMYFVYRNFAGLNEIEPLMHDPYIEDIGCSGLSIPTYIVHTKFGSIKTNLIFNDEDTLKNLVVKLAERCGKYI
ncbi:MAG: hypothetical protein SVU32_01885, partial [Candidatus Nanohaloarchaea archaeon]|nr:hypothetical protein [Candidatus Nanohaloarchaea archaeon]